MYTLVDMKQDNIFKGIVLIQIMLTIDLLVFYFSLGSQTLSLFRYGVYFFATYYLLKGIVANHRKPTFFEGLFFVWIMYIIVNGFLYAMHQGVNTPYFKQFISGNYTLFLVPILMISNLSLDFFKRYYKLSYNLGIITVIFVGLEISNILFVRVSPVSEAFIYGAMGLSLVVMTYPYLRKKQSYVTIGIIILMIFVMMLLGRRNKVVYWGSVLFFALLLNTICRTYLSNGASKIKILFMVCCLGLVIMTNFSDAFSSFLTKMDGGMSSREGIIELFYFDFNNQPADWVFGRGMYGSFVGGVLSEDDLTGTRSGIENGYLQLILKGGWIWLGFMIFLSIKTFYLGLFKSKNLLCKGMALIIFVYFIDMIGFGIPNLHLGYINVFIAMSGCNSKWLRNMTDEELQPDLCLK